LWNGPFTGSIEMSYFVVVTNGDYSIYRKTIKVCANIKTSSSCTVYSSVLCGVEHLYTRKGKTNNRYDQQVTLST